MNKTYSRFFKYFSVGFSTFLLDLFLLYLLTDIFLLNYLVATGAAFLVAVSINYYFSRKYVFKRTERKFSHGYYVFILITAVGLMFVLGLMAILVGMLHWYYLAARVLVAGIVGMWNYLMNLFVNFKVAGKH